MAASRIVDVEFAPIFGERTVSVYFRWAHMPADAGGELFADIAFTEFADDGSDISRDQAEAAADSAAFQVAVEEAAVARGFTD